MDMPINKFLQIVGGVKVDTGGGIFIVYLIASRIALLCVIGLFIKPLTLAGGCCHWRYHNPHGYSNQHGIDIAKSGRDGKSISDYAPKEHGKPGAQEKTGDGCTHYCATTHSKDLPLVKLIASDDR